MVRHLNGRCGRRWCQGCSNRRLQGAARCTTGLVSEPNNNGFHRAQATIDDGGKGGDIAA
jgi:hypothetical protein